jgi:hypothetical protein
MDVKALRDTPPWEWPEGTGKMFLDILRDDRAAEGDRLPAAELAGEFTVINDELVDALLATLRSGDESAKLRGRAVISLGPVLEATKLLAATEEGRPVSHHHWHKGPAPGNLAIFVMPERAWSPLNTPGQDSRKMRAWTSSSGSSGSSWHAEFGSPPRRRKSVIATGSRSKTCWSRS